MHITNTLVCSSLHVRLEHTLKNTLYLQFSSYKQKSQAVTFRLQLVRMKFFIMTAALHIAEAKKDALLFRQSTTAHNDAC
jgi:hypothetical protein